MKSGLFIELTACTLGVELGTAKLIARSLREAGWLTTGPRGTNAPDMKPEDAARLIIALMTGAPPARALQSFLKFRKLKCKDHNGKKLLGELLAYDGIEGLDQCVTSIIERTAVGFSIAKMDHFGAPVENLELLLNVSQGFAYLKLGGHSFHFFAAKSDANSEVQNTKPTECLDNAKGSLAMHTRETLGIQTTRAITMAEIRAIADGISAGSPSGVDRQVSSLRKRTNG